jgi:hypothetical protein
VLLLAQYVFGGYVDMGEMGDEDLSPHQYQARGFVAFD